MRTAELLEAIEHAAREVKLAKLTRSVLTGVRYAHENDAETLKRVVEEYRACKYESIPIPDSREPEEEDGVAIHPKALPRLLEKADDVLDQAGTTSDLDEVYGYIVKARDYITRALGIS